MAAPPPYVPPVIPPTNIEISISCRNLSDMDVFSKSDPMVVVYERDELSNKFHEIGRTEIIWNNLNPDFSKKFVVQYHFEECQKYKFEVYDVDCNSPDLSKHDFLGRIETTLGEIVSSGRLEKKLVSGPKGNKGSIILKAEEEITCKDEISLTFCGKKLDKKDFFGLSDPFLCFRRVNEDGSSTVCHRTEAIKNTLNPTWKKFTLPSRVLCNGDYHRPIIVECFDWNNNGNHSLIGVFNTTAEELASWPNGPREFPLIHPEKSRKKKKYTNSGTIHLLFAEKVEVASFLDFIQGGTELNCTIAIDFTASNGDPRQPGTLHYLNPYQPTQYATALQAVGEIIQDYDSDNLFPAFGFGARLPPDFGVSHCFPLNFCPDNPFCQGIGGVMQAYHDSIKAVQLYGPTNFAPCINYCAGLANMHRDGSQYFILLILTDGIITDMPQTREAIVRASSLPLSIIIVGIGDADFDAMDELDGDEDRLCSRGRYAERDIVQFVPFRDFAASTSGNISVAKRSLAKAVLEEIPDQLVSYMRANNIKPRRVTRVNRQSVSSSHSSISMHPPVSCYESPPPYQP